MELDWSDEETILHNLLLTELDEESQTLFTQVYPLEHGCPLLHFLFDNGRTRFTAEDIAFNLKAPPASVEWSLHVLVERGLVSRTDIAGISFFSLTEDREGQQRVGRLCAWQGRWQARLARMARLIGLETSHPPQPGPRIMVSNEDSVVRV